MALRYQNSQAEMKFVDTKPSLLARIRDGSDREAWGKFVELYAPVVYGMLSSTDYKMPTPLILLKIPSLA